MLAFSSSFIFLFLFSVNVYKHFSDRHHVVAMKSAILYPYDNFGGRGCCRLLNPKHAAITAAIYTLVSATVMKLKAEK